MPSSCPIGNANYVPLPLGFQGRVRTLSEGIFYPIGLALAGAVLWTADPAHRLAPGRVRRPGLCGPLCPTERRDRPPVPADPAGQRRRGPDHARPGDRRRGGAHGARQDAVAQPRAGAAPAWPRAGAASRARALEDDLLALATQPDRTTRSALARLVAAAPRHWAQGFLDRCLAGGTEEEAKLALCVLLIRRAPLQPEQLRARARRARSSCRRAGARGRAKASRHGPRSSRCSGTGGSPPTSWRPSCAPSGPTSPGCCSPASPAPSPSSNAAPWSC